MTHLLAKALAHVLHAGNQRVEALFPGKTPGVFLEALVSELDRKNGTAGAELPYSIWVRKQPAGDSPLEQRHVKLSGEVVSYRNNHPRILVYREGDYEPIAGVVGSARSILPPAFPLDESVNVNLELTVATALEVLAEGNAQWVEVDQGLVTELTAVIAKWANVLESMTGQELGWNDAWWRYAIAAFERLAALDPVEIKAKGVCWAACFAGRYPLPPDGQKVSTSRWSKMSEVVTSVFGNTETAQEAVKRYEVREKAPHPASVLQLENIDRLLPLSPDDNSGNLGLALAAIEDPEGKCWGAVSEAQMDVLLSITTGGSNQAKITAILDGSPVDLPINGASSKKRVHLLPIKEWEHNLTDGRIVFDVENLLLVLPWSEQRDREAPIPVVQPDAVHPEIGCRPAAGIRVTPGRQTAGAIGLEVNLSLRISFKLGKVWKTGPYHLQVEVPDNHPAWAQLEPLYEARLVIPTPWGVSVVCSHGPNRSSVKATGDSVFNLGDGGEIAAEELGSVTIRQPSAPVVADLLVYDASQDHENWGPDAVCDSLVIGEGRPSEHWSGCWEAPGLELQQGGCVEDPESGDVILDVDVQEPDNRPVLPLMATLQDTTPGSLPLSDSFYGEHLLLARMDELLARHLLQEATQSPHGLAQIVAVPGPSKLAKKLTPVGNILWPFAQDAEGGPQARHVGWQAQGKEKEEISLAIGQSMTLDDVCGYFDGQGIDRNGIGRTEMRMLKTLKERGAIAAGPLMQACGISNNRDFTSVWEYSQRLGLVEIVAGGRALTQLGRSYLLNPGSIDLRDKIV